MIELSPDFVRELRNNLAGEVRDDLTTRILYSTDASIYQIEPLGVAFPRTQDDLSAAVTLAAQFQVPVLARGSGSSLGGQAIGPALILDTSRYLTKILDVNPNDRTATVEPGVILTNLNQLAGRVGLVFGPDPSSAERSTMGGSIANNATGAHSIIYGMAADHLVSADVILSDGSQATLSEVSIEEAYRKAGFYEAGNGYTQSANKIYRSIEESLYSEALAIRDHQGDMIRSRWPKVWRRASGYNLNYLFNWSPTSPPQWYGEELVPTLPYPPVPAGRFNLAPLLAGSEGTLAVIKSVTVNMVPKPKATVLGLLVFDDVVQACDVIPDLLETHPSAVELIPGNLLRMAREVPAYQRKMTFVEGNPAALLVVEYAGETQEQFSEQVRRLGPGVYIAATPEQQKQIWDIRKVGLGIINSLPGDAKPQAFIEDLIVPVETLGKFLREMERILAGFGTTANYYGHASTGCLHIRPILSIKDAAGVKAMRSIAEQAVALTLSLGGVVSGEHGDGIARSEWLERTFGPDIMGLFRRVKQAADPNNLLNPGKIIDAPPMDTNLRYGAGYQSREWRTVMDFSRQGSLSGAVEMCNGASVCRKEDGVMCPSYQVTREEMHSTRGRANLLRAMMSGKFPSQRLAEEAVSTALDLCLACKGCKSECPSAVDLAKLKYEFYNEYYRSHPRKWRDYLFGYIDLFAPLGSLLSPLSNYVMGTRPVRKLFERRMGLSARRAFPAFAPFPLVWKTGRNHKLDQPDVLFLTDTFSRYFHPETEKAGRRALEQLGLRVQVIPIQGAGRTLISKGFLEPAHRHAKRLLAVIDRLDPESRLPVVAVEPSEILTLRDEYLDFFPGDEKVRDLAKRAWMIDEFLVRPGEDGNPRITKIAQQFQGRGDRPKVFLHGHCYQKAQPPAEDGYPTGVPATVSMLEKLGYIVQVIDSGCCGMAGAFGYESEHYDLSMKVGEQFLFPAVRQAGTETIIAAAGTSCRSQITDATGRGVTHPVCLIDKEWIQ